ncbi:MAG TPA: RNA polymerase sigma factor [Planctomycetota bacterium]|nr:RNA polymerase sigma factor [Planctomycetota bacterium]
MDDADSQLVAAWRTGDDHAFEQLYQRHAERVWRYARYFCGDEDAAAEVVQESFVRVAQHASRFEGRSSFSTWLFTIVRSVSVDAASKRRRAPVAASGEEWMERVPATSEGPDERVALNETRAAVRTAISRLPENEREAVLLCEIEDMPLREAAAILGWGESRIKVTLFRARRRLKEMLSSHVEARTP